MVYMTEIIAKDIEIRKGVVRHCAIDNHNRKHGKDFTILYKAKTLWQLSEFMYQKGIW